MIDIETGLFSRIVDTLEERYDWAKDVLFVNDIIASSQQFPCVAIFERENRTANSGQDSSGEENFSVLDYEVDVYTNSKETRREEARKIMDAIDRLMISMNFRRRTMEQVPNLEDWSVFRLLARYTVITDRAGTLYRRP